MICQICHVVHHLNNWQAHDGLQAGKEIGGLWRGLSWLQSATNSTFELHQLVKVVKVHALLRCEAVTRTTHQGHWQMCANLFGIGEQVQKITVQFAARGGHTL